MRPERNSFETGVYYADSIECGVCLRFCRLLSPARRRRPAAYTAAVFSGRLPWSHPTNRLTRVLAEKRAAGAHILDLTESNPTRAGLDYPLPDIAAVFAVAAMSSYDPAPRGLVPAREAVAAYYGRRGHAVRPDHVILTASTSEAYAWLLKLLADPGDAILVPSPSYPLFDYLAGLESVRTVPYQLVLEERWRLDMASVERAAREAGPAGPRAIVVVNPNNPTGTAVTREELEFLESFAAARNIPLISDEVFFDYLTPDGVRSGAATTAVPVSLLPGGAHDSVPRALRFVLGGLSKSCGLPHLKLGWIVVHGPDEAADAAIDRLELVADTYLSAGTPVMVAAPRLLELGETIQAGVRRRVDENRAHLVRTVGTDTSCRVLPADGGWSAVLQVPATIPEEDLVLQLLDKDGVLVHPGYFFDFPREAYLVPSLLPAPGEFREAVGRILQRIPR